MPQTANRVAGWNTYGELATRTADTLVLAMAVALPWSISVSTILAVCWMAALLLGPYVREVGKELGTWAGGVPVAVWAAAMAATLWTADVGWPERIKALDDLHRLWAIPFLLAQFRISPYGRFVLIGFVASCSALLILSYAMYFVPALSWRWARSPGVPVKDYVAQSGEFVLCAFGLLVVALRKQSEGKFGMALGLTLLAAAFLLNVGYVAAGRTAIVAALGLLIWLGLRTSNWRLGLATVLTGTALLGVVFTTSPYLQNRLHTLVQETKSYSPDRQTDASAAVRVEFWRRSLLIIEAAPWFGHGTGSIQQQFEKTATGTSGLSALVTRNPHNQTLAIAIQLGALGAILLWLMWLCHLWLFRAADTISLIGSIVVIQSIVGCLFNSHLSDFTQGSLYVIGVGVVGGMVARAKQPLSAATPAR